MLKSSNKSWSPAQSLLNFIAWLMQPEHMASIPSAVLLIISSSELVHSAAMDVSVVWQAPLQ